MKKTLGWLAAFSLLLLGGCNVGNSNEANDGDRSLVRVRNTVDEQVENKSGQEIARRIAEIANRVPNVHDATAIVVGKYAIVGIDVGANVDASRVGTIKYSVAEALQKDPYGANAIIVADPDLYTRVRNIGRQIDEGRPVQAFMNEIADIVGRVMPEVPSDLFETTPNPTEENDGQLNNQEERQLNEHQEKQSNHHLNR
ncbi:YhcN/YlaJ family sporulation lipoprotein [Geobacillus stearothermophilus]|uniref:YhcN/YlaJ family sporulation lipoprotein n=1 Tax=Geobacillus stearothermophilus TaxID=1422 RepID=UPI002E238623|nr:YhcN/YlaJ family sporulation lipoprotein [Geobacillus stearothermophilus]MED4270766.1 YhcN/YlaJ family sporulation lipoprotein [Geobacillus stearothermophilus]